MKNGRKLFVSATVLAVGILALLTYVYASTNVKYVYANNRGQKYQNAPHECPGRATISLDNGTVLNSTGTMTMHVVTNSAPDDPVHRQTLSPVSFDASGDDPALGHVTWTLDASRTVEETVIQGNNVGEDFPATCDIIFYVQGTFSSQPGITYRSMTPIHMRSTNLQSFNPHINETYQLVDPVQFENADNPDGGVAFTITGLTSILG
jgi:hypothetical protein